MRFTSENRAAIESSTSTSRISRSLSLRAARAEREMDDANSSIMADVHLPRHMHGGSQCAGAAERARGRRASMELTLACKSGWFMGGQKSYAPPHSERDASLPRDARAVPGRLAQVVAPLLLVAGPLDHDGEMHLQHGVGRDQLHGALDEGLGAASQKQGMLLVAVLVFRELQR